MNDNWKEEAYERLERIGQYNDVTHIDACVDFIEYLLQKQSEDMYKAITMVRAKLKEAI